MTLEPAAREAIVRLASGDARRALTALEAAAQSAAAGGAESGEPPVITAEIVAAAVDRALLRYDKQGDEHYDVISAFIKSIRGSDPDAALHYLARMIEAGEDVRFIARRVIISAAEDIGTADPQALPLAVAAAQAVQLIGMPEGRIPLAEAVVYLATAPKSNAAYVGIDAAIADVKAGRLGRVPKPLRDAHYPGAKRLTTSPWASPSSSICPMSSSAPSTTGRASAGMSARSVRASRSCVRSSVGRRARSEPSR